METIEKPSAKWSPKNRAIMAHARTADARGFRQWKAAGRQVRKGEHGVKVLTFVPMSKVVHSETGDKVESWRSPRSTTVFHVSQTDAIRDKNG